MWIPVWKIEVKNASTFDIVIILVDTYFMHQQDSQLSDRENFEREMWDYSSVYRKALYLYFVVLVVISSLSLFAKCSTKTHEDNCFCMASWLIYFSLFYSQWNLTRFLRADSFLLICSASVSCHMGWNDIRMMQKSTKKIWAAAKLVMMIMTDPVKAFV